jgi:lipopolysaccharide/colanic/teichoic acid biosynthesis glycosyltransferase
MAEVEGVPIVGELSQIAGLSRYHQAGQMFFLVDAVSHEQVLHVMTQLQDRDIIFKIVPNTLDYIIGKSNVEYLDNIPLVDVQLLYNSTWNRFAKRNLDLLISIPLFVILLPVLGIPWLIQAGKRKEQKFYQNEQRFFTLKLLPDSYPKWMNLLSKLFYVITGKISLVGAPLIPDQNKSLLYYKYGLTGLRQQRGPQMLRQDQADQADLHYLQSYSVWLDLDLLVKALIKR